LSIKALVIGYGSIGQRHVEILNMIDNITQITVLSNQSNLSFNTIKSMDEISEINPDYLIVASNTATHYRNLSFIENNLRDKKILMEKPLFHSFYEFKVKNNQVFVGYNLRFHPIIQLIKEKINIDELWNIQVFCGSYLPSWRPGRDYKKTSSAKQEMGGGVLLELSHELDYIQWLIGAINIKNVVNEKVSDLEIETDDLLLLSGKSEYGAHVHISLNYFSRQPIRKLIFDGKGISIQADLITNSIYIDEKSKQSEFSFPDYNLNESYLLQHNAIINGDISNVCSYKEGLQTMLMIDNIKSFNQQ